MQQKEFLQQLDQQRIVDAIKRAEGRTSGEIRVHVQPKAGADIRKLAEKTFERLGMTITKLRNGVLLFVATEEQRFVILGDRGIDLRLRERVELQALDDLVRAVALRAERERRDDAAGDAVAAVGHDRGAEPVVARAAAHQALHVVDDRLGRGERAGRAASGDDLFRCDRPRFESR